MIKKQKRAVITIKLFAQKHNKQHVKALHKHDLIEKDLAKPENYSLLTKMVTSLLISRQDVCALLAIGDAFKALNSHKD